MMERIRTTKCGPITSDMSWQEILAEYRKLNGDNDEVMSLSSHERLLISGAMFAENDHNIVSTFPDGISEREFKERLYFGRYGEHLPEDFFKERNHEIK
jgi:hypothetical protein